MDLSWSSCLSRKSAVNPPRLIASTHAHSSFVFICILFLLHPIDKTLVVQYQLVQGCLTHCLRQGF